MCGKAKKCISLHRIHLRQSVKTRRARVRLFVRFGRKVVDLLNYWCCLYTWWRWDSCGYLLLSLLLINTNDSFYAIALSNSERVVIASALLSENNRRPCWLQISFLYFVFSPKIHKRRLISWIHCNFSEFLNKLLKQKKQSHFLFRSYKPI